MKERLPRHGNVIYYCKNTGNKNNCRSPVSVPVQLGAVGPVSSGISSGSILIIPLYFFNNIYFCLTWGTAALIPRDEDWCTSDVAGYIFPQMYRSVFATMRT